MVRAAALAFLLLAGCDQLEKKDGDAVSLAFKSGEQDVKIAQLQAELDRLKDEQAAQARMISATSNLAEADSDSITSLRDTLNKNVEIDNKRHSNLVDHVAALERSVYRQ